LATTRNTKETFKPQPRTLTAVHDARRTKKLSILVLAVDGQQRRVSERIGNKEATNRHVHPKREGAEQVDYNKIKNFRNDKRDQPPLNPIITGT
jgi:hypothetical protein